MGLPAAGKTTFSKNLIRGNKSYVRTSRDDIRRVLFGENIIQNEDLVVKVRDDIILESLLSGLNVVVDDSNFQADIDKLTNIVNKLNFDVSIKLKRIETPVDVCIERNSEREFKTSEANIHTIHRRYIREKLLYQSF